MPVVQASRHHRRQVLPLACATKTNMLGQGEFFMKRVFQIFAFSLLLSLTGAANGIAASTNWQKQDKPPEKPVEKPKDDKRNDPPKDRGGDKKKPNES